MVGVSVGLGNLWRFPYMTGKFGGAAFVLVYVVAIAAVGVPALLAEWTLGRSTRRGPVGAYEVAGVPFGRALGWAFFAAVTAATGYYAAVIGWTAFYALAEAGALLGAGFEPSVVLPPESGFAGRSYLIGASFTLLVVAAAAAVLVRGLRRGIEAASAVLVPLLFVALLLVIGRALALPGAVAGVEWYVLKFDAGSLSPGVAVAALGQAIFSLGLGGTFMVVYGSYLEPDAELGPAALWTAAGDTAVGLLGGLAIFPAVFALGLDPASGPDLVFGVLPEVFDRVPGGDAFGVAFFAGLAGAAFLSAVAAFEVLVAGLTDNTDLGRRRAVGIVAGAVFLLSLPPTVNLSVFVPWDLTFGSGLQTCGALLAVGAAAWAVDRSRALREIAGRKGEGGRLAGALYGWIRYVVPAAILLVGAWWVAEEVLAAGGA